MGTSIAQAIPIVASPLMTRLFSPQDYGLLAIYMSVVGLVAIAATGTYTHAIMLAEKDEDALNIMALCAVITSTLSIITFLVVLLFRYQISHLLQSDAIAYWLLLIPISIFLSGIYQALNYWMNRKRAYRRLAVNRVAQTSIATSSQLVLGFFKFGAGGLISTYICSSGIGASLLGWQFWKEDRNKLQAISRHKMKEQGSLYRRFPLYSLPTDFINVATNQVPILLLTVFVGVGGVGLYNLSQRVLGLPAGLVASSISDVFRQRASSDYAKHGNCRDIYVKTFKTLFLLAIIPFTILFIIAPPLFAFVFGEKWREAGEYIRVMLPMIFLGFTSSPLSYVYYIAGKQREDLFLHIYMAASTAVSLWIGHLLFDKSVYVLMCFSINYSLIYVVYLIRSYTFSKGNPKNNYAIVAAV
jgi:O-antigen/teichoic acid export membrane protein